MLNPQDFMRLDDATMANLDLVTCRTVTGTDNTATIQQTAVAVAEIDVLAGLAERGRKGRYVCPKMTDGDKIHLQHSQEGIFQIIADIAGWTSGSAHGVGDIHIRVVAAGHLADFLYQSPVQRRWRSP
ncbi:MAG: hypothetical protein EOM20_19065 [Spartobacteria bacterium]|nr:hypothetical protein [Spartobacteria bacterium]